MKSRKNVRSACQMLQSVVSRSRWAFQLTILRSGVAPPAANCPSCRGSPQGESKDFNMHDRAVMVNAFAIKEAGARARAAMGSA
jgi:hypothetical protein